MGIPSYFSYIIRKHPYIITALQKADNLYLDSNSIIYDMVHSMEQCDGFETKLIQLVCEKIDFYLSLVSPKRVFIAFDGVPPMAKVKQQRERRYKGWMTQKMTKEKVKWNTVQITPGTSFMNALDKELTRYFQHHPSKYESFALSTSSEMGEGEHKLFSFIREHPEFHLNQKTLIYGLDSDLIVLSLNHLKYGEIRLLREAPAFMLSDRELHVLDVPKLAEGICEIIGDTKMEDYIFMTLLLGNDFMPHFPALNLRTNGFDTLLKTYTMFIARHEHLVKETIQWDIVKKFIIALSEQEHNIITREYHARNRTRIDTSSEEKRINSLPILQREKEHFICPIQKNWEERYYSSLFTNASVPDICKNYTDMLTWNMDYYTSGCKDWAIQYNYMYPPLLIDLKNHIPTESHVSVHEPTMTPHELLEYVLPPIYHSFIPNGSSKEQEQPKLEWAYCKYLWESHVQF